MNKEKNAVSAVELDELAEFKNIGTSIKTLKDYEESGGKKGRSSKFFTLSDGETTVRFLPGLKDEPFFYETAYHWLNGDKVYCRKLRSKEDRCPICDFAFSVWNASKEETNAVKIEKLQTQAKSLFTKEDFFFNVVVRGKNGEEDKVVVLKAGATVKKEVVKLFFNEDYKDVTHLLTGTDITITKTGSKKETRYSITPKRKTSYVVGTQENPPTKQRLQEVLDQRKDIATLVDYPTEELAREKLEAYRSTFERAPESAEVHDDETADLSNLKQEQFDSIDAALNAASAGR